MFKDGETVTIDVDLGASRALRRLVVKSRQLLTFNGGCGVSKLTVWLSADGFRNDRRQIGDRDIRDALQNDLVSYAIDLPAGTAGTVYSATLQASGGVNVQTTDGDGEVSFNRDDGDWTYVIEDSALYTGSSGTITVASGVVTDPADAVLDITGISLPTPSSPDNYVIFAYELEGDNGDVAFGAGELSIKITDMQLISRTDAAAYAIRNLKGKTYETDADGVWSFEMGKEAVAAGGVIVMERSWEDDDEDPRAEVWRVTLDASKASVLDQIALADLSIVVQR